MSAARAFVLSALTCALLAVSLAGCPPECGPMNCDGCCLEGECQSGKARLACGGSGLTCTACTFAEVCSGARCVPAPDAGMKGVDGGVVLRPDGGIGVCSCPGGCCTPAGQCLAGTTPDACGSDGGTCLGCGALQLCAQGSCTAVPQCPGCTTGDGRCGDGSLQDVCGRDGGLCVRCATTERCVGGACVAPCSAATCTTGCCMTSGACVAPPTAAACGTLGRACAACDAGLSCVAGVCG